MKTKYTILEMSIRVGSTSTKLDGSEKFHIQYLQAEVHHKLWNERLLVAIAPPQSLHLTPAQIQVEIHPVYKRMFEKSSSVCFTTQATEKLLRENRSFGI
ncbi:hypothetical protein [Nostoc sp.]|uniref:hypothetical protein n=1 Tax=Nostoc sp. TaxID=1180 RepID=UPI002FF67E23